MTERISIRETRTHPAEVLRVRHDHRVALAGNLTIHCLHDASARDDALVEAAIPSISSLSAHWRSCNRTLGQALSATEVRPSSSRDDIQAKAIHGLHHAIRDAVLVWYIGRWPDAGQVVDLPLGLHELVIALLIRHGSGVGHRV